MALWCFSTFCYAISIYRSIYLFVYLSIKQSIILFTSQKTLAELDDLKRRESESSQQIQTLSKESTEAKNLIESRKEHPEVAKKYAILNCEVKKWKRWSNIQNVAGHRMLHFLEKTHADLMQNREEGQTKSLVKGKL